MTVGTGSAKRAVWGFLDQGVSSLINFGVGLLVARSVTQTAFGAFSIAFALYIVLLVATRALASEPLLIRHSHQPVRHWRRAVAGATGMALLLGGAAGPAIALVGVLVGGLVAEALVPLSVALVGLLLQDTLRFAFVARGRPAAALAIDLAWLAMLAPALIILDGRGGDVLGWSILIWGATAFVAASAGFVVARTAPSPSKALLWWARHRDIGPRYLAEGLMSLAASQTTVIVVGAISGLGAAGGLRGAQLLLGPMQVLLIGLSIIGIPEGVAMLRARGARSLVPPALILSAVMCGMALAYGLALTALPEELGELVLGDTWDQARPLLLLMALAYAGVTAGLGAGIGLRVLADAPRSLRSRATDALAQTTGGIGGAAMGGASGAAVGLAIGGWLGAGATWRQFLAAVRAAASSDDGSALVTGSAPGDGRTASGSAGTPTDRASTATNRRQDRRSPTRPGW